MSLIVVWPSGVLVKALACDSREVATSTPPVPLLVSNRGQVVHTHVPLSASNIIRYMQGSDVLRLER